MVLYFYGQYNSHGFLSNFYPATFIITANIIGLSQEIEVNSAEKAIMWLKALLMGDLNSASSIANESNPSICKKYGRNVKPFDNAKWHDNRDKIALEVLTLKFQHPDLKKLLLQTNLEILAEASPTDKIWGIGISSAAALKGEQWNGENILGNTLMKVRTNLLLGQNISNILTASQPHPHNEWSDTEDNDVGTLRPFVRRVIIKSLQSGCNIIRYEQCYKN